jgi:hypothetical protein
MSNQRMGAIGLGTISAVGGIAGVAALSSLAAPVTVAGAVAASFVTSSMGVGLAVGVSKLVVSVITREEQLHGSMEQVDKTSGYAQPGNLGAKLADSMLGTGNKLERTYEIAKAFTDMARPPGKEAAEMIHSLSEKAEAVLAAAEAALRAASKEASSQSQQQSPGKSLGSENNFGSNH